ncbi:hypothetical protein F5B20DRAFT_357664 [Whalleya microplaca]|nr:hypothetical protein F5B20DRAFT_357664 [Whalleya microplaca]
MDSGFAPDPRDPRRRSSLEPRDSLQGRDRDRLQGRDRYRPRGRDSLRGRTRTRDSDYWSYYSPGRRHPRSRSPSPSRSRSRSRSRSSSRSPSRRRHHHHSRRSLSRSRSRSRHRSRRHHRHSRRHHHHTRSPSPSHTLTLDHGLHRDSNDNRTGPRDRSHGEPQPGPNMPGRHSVARPGLLGMLGNHRVDPPRPMNPPRPANRSRRANPPGPRMLPGHQFTCGDQPHQIRLAPVPEGVVIKQPSSRPADWRPLPADRSQILCGNCNQRHDPARCHGPPSRKGMLDICVRCGVKTHLYDNCAHGDINVDDNEYFLWYLRQGLFGMSTRISLDHLPAQLDRHVRAVWTAEFTRNWARKERAKPGRPSWDRVGYRGLAPPEVEALRRTHGVRPAAI